MGSVLCEHCTGACCRYIALPIEEPTTKRDFDDIRWYMMHRGVSVFVEDGEWFIQMASDCRNLLPNNMCNAYDTRPEICREYKAGDCDYAGGDYHYEVHLTSVRQVEEYAAKKLGKKDLFSKPTSSGKKRASRKNHPLKLVARKS